ncbi:trypsin-like peptidase domain-containing protein [Microcoleus sp. CAWBG58]|uniref:trypsin-like peptidase domain-containing protein n=1 Tax=Microcoleus sp. CAWBG58 TaxID=2841651 RepID=UPI0025DAA0E2|nr:trypsin-like peptidase domain-containing protein [Microcoleus sp. CAWBG58]
MIRNPDYAIKNPDNKKTLLEGLYTSLMTDEDPKVRSACANALEICGEEAIPYLCKALNQQEFNFIRLEIIAILGKFGNYNPDSQHKQIISFIIPLPEPKQMNPEIFLEPRDVTPLMKALIPIFTRINGENNRRNLLENANVDPAFISSNLILGESPVDFTQALIAAFRSYKISIHNDYHPQTNVLASLVNLAEFYGLSDQDLKLFNRLITQGEENFKALIARNAVGRIESPQGRGIGTGVLVAQNLLLTCYHIFTKTRVEKAWVRFGYKSDSYGTEDTYELDLNFVENHPHLDYALIRLQPTPSLQPIRPVNAILDSGQKIRLIHHPQGKPVEISGLSEIVQVGPEYIDHNLNTDAGSSGAPIFNHAWELVAIHQGNPGVARLTKGKMGGQPISAIWNQIANHLDLK